MLIESLSCSGVFLFAVYNCQKQSNFCCLCKFVAFFATPYHVCEVFRCSFDAFEILFNCWVVFSCVGAFFLNKRLWYLDSHSGHGFCLCCLCQSRSGFFLFYNRLCLCKYTAYFLYWYDLGLSWCFSFCSFKNIMFLCLLFFRFGFFLAFCLRVRRWLLSF
jgi:hypothetical protein